MPSDGGAWVLQVTSRSALGCGWGAGRAEVTVRAGGYPNYVEKTRAANNDLWMLTRGSLAGRIAGRRGDAFTQRGARWRRPRGRAIERIGFLSRGRTGIRRSVVTRVGWRVNQGSGFPNRDLDGVQRRDTAGQAAIWAGGPVRHSNRQGMSPWPGRRSLSTASVLMKPEIGPKRPLLISCPALSD